MYSNMYLSLLLLLLPITLDWRKVREESPSHLIIIVGVMGLYSVFSRYPFCILYVLLFFCYVCICNSITPTSAYIPGGDRV